MNDALKELFNAYKHLPVGVMFFKNGELFFVNDHLRGVLLVDNLSSDDIIQIIGGMIQLESPSHASLIKFLLQNDFFYYGDRIVQIEREKIGDIDIVVLVRLSDKAIDAVDSTQSIRLMRSEKTSVSLDISDDQQKILNKALGTWEHETFPSIVLYKGIPIKGNVEILAVEQGEMKLKVEKKQLIGAQMGTQWIAGSKRDTMLSATVSRYDLKQRCVWLKNLTIISEGFHQRKVIRYYADENDRFIISFGGKKISLPLRRVSEKGVSVHTDDAASLVTLSSIAGRTLDVQLVLEGKTISVNAVWLYTIALDSSLMKAAFTIGYDLHNGAILREWLNMKQLKIIKEVRNFVEMLPSPEREMPQDWVI